MTNPTVSWTDGIGAVTLTCLVPAFSGWTPDINDVGESANPVTGQPYTYFFGYRQDNIVTFNIPSIASTELPFALRLKSHLLLGGTAVVVDDLGVSYTVRIAPGTIPKVRMSDNIDTEYTLELVVLVTT